MTLTLPGLRGADPDDRCRGRREHRHLRTHQGGVARGQVRARGDLRRLREGLPHDHRRQRRHGDHGARPLRRSRPRASRDSRSCSCRHRDLDGHRRLRDARDARPARRVQLVRQPAVHGRGRRADAASGMQIDFIGKRKLWFAISGAVILDQRRLARRQGAEPRHRLQGRHADLVHDAAARSRSTTSATRRPKIGQGGAVDPGPRAGARGGNYTRVPDPDGGADRGRAVAAPARPHRGRERADLRRDDRVGELRLADREERDLRDHLLAAPDRRATSRSASTGSSPSP